MIINLLNVQVVNYIEQFQVMLQMWHSIYTAWQNVWHLYSQVLENLLYDGCLYADYQPSTVTLRIGVLIIILEGLEHS